MAKEKKYPKAIYNWPEDERPRERLLKFGADKLSDTELLAILLRVGSSVKSAVDMARELVNEFGTFGNIDSKSFSELKRKGLGIAKITQIKAEVAESSEALVLIHNHPSGEPQPSQDDIEITNRIISACELVGIKVLDHIIIGDNNYFSFFKEGLIKEG